MAHGGAWPSSRLRPLPQQQYDVATPYLFEDLHLYHLLVPWEIELTPCTTRRPHPVCHALLFYDDIASTQL